MNKRVAYVYGGAAFLILVFGFRTLARTTELNLDVYLTPVTIVALLAEFCLLVYYAYGIYHEPTDSGPVSTGRVSGTKSTDLKPALNKLDEVNTTLGNYASQLTEIKDHLATHNEEIKNLNGSIESLIDEQLGEKVKKILTDIIGKKLSK